MFEKNKWGQAYTQLLTGSPWFFMGFILAGIFLLAFLGMDTEIPLYKTLPMAVIEEGALLECALFEGAPYSGRGYLYFNKNEAVYQISLIHSQVKLEGALLSDWERSGRPEYFVDIPVGKETLLKRIFLKGGKAHE